MAPQSPPRQNAPAPPPPSQPQQSQHVGDYDKRGKYDDDDRHEKQSKQYHYKRRKSFLEELFD